MVVTGNSGRTKNESVHARIRVAVAHWPDGAPRGAVIASWGEHGITSGTVCAFRARAWSEGQTTALEPSGLAHGQIKEINNVVSVG